VTVESVDAHHVLRARIARIERQRPVDAPALTPLGLAGLDAALGGGLARGRLHELYATEPEDGPAAAGFAAMLACTLLPAGAPLLWLRQDEAERGTGRLHAPGLAEIGLDPARLLLGVLPDPVTLLRAAADAMRCADIGAVVIEPWRDPKMLDLTASRRLAVAAEGSGVTALMLRARAEPAPSAAQTRWAVRAAPSVALEAQAPGYPSFEVELLRQRGRPAGGTWRLDWDRERVRFGESPASGAVAAAAERGPAEGAASLRIAG
jgi:protein ImuA